MADKAYCIIGGGVMGEAIGRSLISTGTASASAIIICDIDAKRRSYLESDLGVTVTGEHAEACQAAPVVVLAVKPQDFRTISNSLQGRILPEQLVLSIMAGVNVGTLRNQLGHRALVRVMPNTPAQIGKGMAVWTATPEVNDEQRATVRRILQTLGIELYVPDERYIDMATAVSGSGPGFFFLILEANSRPRWFIKRPWVPPPSPNSQSCTRLSYATRSLPPAEPLRRGSGPWSSKACGQGSSKRSSQPMSEPWNLDKRREWPRYHPAHH